MTANPRYDASGELVCGACGKPLGRAPNRFGDSIASCSDPGCKGNGMMFAEGSFRHNPAIPENRRTPYMMDHPSRFYIGPADWKVVDDRREDQGIGLNPTNPTTGNKGL